MMTTRWKYGALATILGCGLLATSACSVGPDDLPSVRGGVGAGYRLELQFASTMNLPTGADVMMDGLRVGEVEKLTAAGEVVKVDAHVKDGTKVPADIRAVIRQNTLLGDTYIALDHGAVVQGPYLPPGGTVTVEHTSSPPQLEDTMAVLAYFVNGGSIQKIEDAMTGINAVMPQPRDVQRLASVVAGDMRDLAGDTNEIDRLLNGFSDTGAAIDAKGQTLATLFSQPSEHYWRRTAVNIVSYISQILPSVGSVYEGGLWLVPMLDSLADTSGVARGIWDSAPADTAKLSEFLRATMIPFAADPSVNIRSVDSASGDHMVADVENLLRMLGAVK
ncbi:Mce family protein MceE [Nocardia nova SH22a]|uniref:Mce family protein MceE n=1 Tax=Nocardia nova SH22a TaxID=1415166 RepID=W5TKK8_9NOCA|nr:MlaD family protein [Nocardia nova]AHH19870.1 Mce family protein MceE [Nocardia nova SH22a]